MEEREYETMAAVEDRHFWFVAMRATVRDAFLALGLPREARVLDLGCGTGGTMKALHGLARFTGLDRSSTAARFATRRTGEAVLCGLATDLPVRDNSVDAVLALDVFEHIPDDARAVEEVRRILKPGGALVATVPCHPALFSEHDRALHHVRRYTRDGFLALLSAHGLHPVRATWTNATLYPLVAVVRWIRRTRNAGHAAALSDASRSVGPLNAVLKQVMMTERWFLRRGNLPWGIGLLVVARRRESIGRDER